MQDWEASGGKGKGKGWGYPNDQYGSGKGAKGRGQDNVWQGQAPSWNSGSDWYSWYGRNGNLILLQNPNIEQFALTPLSMFTHAPNQIEDPVTLARDEAIIA